MWKKSLIGLIEIFGLVLLSSCGVNHTFSSESITTISDNSNYITSFSLADIPSTITANNIAVTVPFGTDISALKPTITISAGAGLYPSAEVSQNFKGPIRYTVTAANGTLRTYTVTVSIAANSSKDITAFAILGVSGKISADAISLTVPYGTSLKSLKPKLTITGARVSPAKGSVQNFEGPVTYTVTAADGTSKKYTVTVHTAANSSKEITGFTILGIDGNISTNAISLTVPYGTDLSSLTPTIVHTGATVSPESNLPQSFESPVTYIVTAADGTASEYTVTVNVAANSSKEITDFTILGIQGVISANEISLTVPYGTDLSSLTPTIVHTGSSVSPASDAPHSFESPVTYTVTAADNTTNEYTVTVHAAANSAKDITSFTILGVKGDIDGDTISLTVPYGSSLLSLIPTIVYTGATVSPASGSPQNFTGSVDYTVTADNGSTKVYTVSVSIAANPLITSFTIPLQVGTTTIDDTKNTITLMMPYLTDVTALIPTFTTNTGATVSPAIGVPTDFTAPVTYVASQGNSRKLYSVNVVISRAGSSVTFSASGVSFNMHYAPGGLSFANFGNAGNTAYPKVAYWVGETSVTYQLWSAVYSWATSPERGANVYTFSNAGQKGSTGTGEVTQPVTTINWRDAMIWTNALTEWYNAINGTQYTCAYYSDAAFTTPIRTSTNSATLTSNTLGTQDDPYVLPTATGFRMLTYMEWFVAAKYKGGDSSNGASQYPIGSGYWWSPDNYASGATASVNNAAATSAVAWFNASATDTVKGTIPRNANALGLYDMSGNVYQWSFSLCYDYGYCSYHSPALGSPCNAGALQTQLGMVGNWNANFTWNTLGFRFARTDN